MRIFHCDHCGQAVFFENTFCGNCGHKLAYLPDHKIVASLDAAPPAPGYTGAPLWTSPVPRAAGQSFKLCDNYALRNVCNWAIPSTDPNTLCASCRLTRVIPDLSVPGTEAAWRALEIAKRRLVYSLMEFRLPLRNKRDDPATGFEFRFLADPVNGGPKVLTGHDEGVITLNIAEADDVERERRRVSMHEPYRTLLGHFRHEVGHYYWDRLVKDSPRIDAFRQQFGDERVDYDQALKTHYTVGPAPDWPQRCVSAYASSHPWEDWAETWAHYLHMTDTLETAAVTGLSLRPSRPDEPTMSHQPHIPANQQKFGDIIKNWFPLTYALNALNRGMGLADAYPFVLPPPAIDKLRFIHETICAGASATA